MDGDISWKTASEMLLKHNRDIIYVCVFDTERFEPVSLSGSTRIRKSRMSSENVPIEHWLIEINPQQARGLYSHIKYGRTAMVQIDLAKLHFVCLRHGTMNCLTGMSNFNMDDNSVQEVDRLLFSITNDHFTRQDSIEGVHALSLAAQIVDDLLIVAICKASEISLLEKLKQLVLIKDGKLSLQPIKQIVEVNENVVQQSDQCNITDETAGTTNVACIPFDESFSNIQTDNNSPGTDVELTDISRVQMRKSTKSDSEKKHEQLKRQTSFCEDWRTATIRSIEALQKNVGPFGLNKKEDDKQPLIDDDIVAWTAGELRLETEVDMNSDSSEGAVEQIRSDTVVGIPDSSYTRKPSRVTLV